MKSGIVKTLLGGRCFSHLLWLTQLQRIVFYVIAYEQIFVILKLDEFDCGEHVNIQCLMIFPGPITFVGLSFRFGLPNEI